MLFRLRSEEALTDLKSDVESELGYHDNERQDVPRRICRLQSHIIHLPRSNSQENWMIRIADDTPLSNLTIPGTHDSAAYTFSWPFVATQKLNFKQQLELGIRYFDIRCGLRDNILELVHGPTYLGVKFSDMLETMYNWLAQNPSEGLVAQIKQDRKDERSSLSFVDAIAQAISQNKSRWLTSTTTPNMGQLRGKIQLFRRYGEKQIDNYGIDVTRWQNNPSRPFTISLSDNTQITIQDHYNFEKPQALPALLAKKEKNVNELLHLADEDLDLNHWYINFTSAYELNVYYQIPPHSIAVGAYWGFRRETGINTRLYRTVVTMGLTKKRRLGVIVMDFPEQGAADLVSILISTNLGSKEIGRAQIVFYGLLLVLISWTILGHVSKKFAVI